MTSRQRLILTPAPATVPEVGVPLAVLYQARADTLKMVAKIADLDAMPERGHSAGTLLYHIALIELDWLYVEVIERPFPADARDWFPLYTRDSEGKLSVVTGEPLDRHLARLAWVRSLLDSAFGSISVEDFRRVRSLEYYDVTPEWVLTHLALHEAHHEGQLALLGTSAQPSSA